MINALFILRLGRTMICHDRWMIGWGRADHGERIQRLRELPRVSGIARASSTRALSTYVGPLFRAQRGARAIEILDEEINEFSVIIPLFFFLTLRS